MIERKPYPDGPESPARILILPIWLIAIYAIGVLLAQAAATSLWIVCAFFLFVLLDPIAEFLKARKWPTIISAIVLVTLATGIAVLTIYILGMLFSGIVKEFDQSKKLFMHAIDSMNISLNSWNTKLSYFIPESNVDHSDVSKVEIVQSSPLGGDFSGTIINGVGSAATIFTFALLVPVLSFFLLAERDGLAKIITRAYFKPETAAITWKKIVACTRAFFLGNLFLAVITFPLFVLLFAAFSVPSLFSMAALATFINIIPFAGAVMSGILPALGLYTLTKTVGAPFALYGCCVAIHFVIADFVTPKILGSRVNINATTSTIALVVWGELWGGIGLLLAIPLTAIVKILFEHSSFFWLHWIAGLMSEDIDGALRVPSQRKPAQKEMMH